MSLRDAILLDPFKSTREVWIARRRDGSKGSGTENDPYDGSTQQRFDSLMRNFMSQNMQFMAIHIGPGVFETKGNAPYDPNQGWEIRRGWKIIGSGIDVTTLKVVGAIEKSGLILAIGPKNFVTVADYAEVSDLTVDCNLPTGPNAPNTATAAVALKGNHVRVRRVRAIRFGTYQLYPGPDARNQPECFVISVGGQSAFLPQPTDCVIENCVVEHRSNIGGGNNITCLSLSSGEVPRTGIMEYHRGCAIRDCSVNGAFEDGGVDFLQQVFGCSPDGGIGAVAEGNQISNVQTGVYHDTWSTREVIVRNNHFRNVYRGAVRQHMGGASALKPGSPLVRSEANARIAILTSFGSHAVQAGHEVNISAAVAVDFTNNLEIVSTLYNGQFTVLSNPAPTANTFAYQMTEGNPPQHHAFGAFVFSYIKDGNTVRKFGFSLTKDPQDDAVAILTAATPHGLSLGPPADTVDVTGAVTWDETSELYETENPFNGTGMEVVEIVDGFTFKYQMAEEPLSEPFPAILFENLDTGQKGFGAPLVRDGDTVSYTTVYPHGLLAGEGVQIRDARVNNVPEDTTYNGFFDISSIPSPTRFTYKLTSVPPGLPDAAGNPSFGRLWQVGLMVFEDNVIELAPTPTGGPVPVGIFISDETDQTVPYIYLRVVVRNNLIRPMEGTSNPNAIGIRIESAKSALVENNLIDLAKTNPLEHEDCGSIQYFNNRASSGKRLRGFNLTTQRKVDELTTRIEDATVMSFF